MGKTYRHTKSDKPFKKKKDYMEEYPKNHEYPYEDEYPSERTREEQYLLDWEDEDDDRPRKDPEKGEL